MNIGKRVLCIHMEANPQSALLILSICAYRNNSEMTPDEDAALMQLCRSFDFKLFLVHQHRLT